MLKKIKHFDTSMELIVQNFHGGIKLNPPPPPPPPSHHDGIRSLKNMLQLPVDVCVINRNGVALIMNERAIARSGFNSLNDCLDKTIFDVANHQTAHFIAYQHNITSHMNKIQMIEYDFIRRDDFKLRCILISYPLYDDFNQLVGILDLSITPDKYPLVESLSHLMEFGLLNKPSHHKDNIRFSKREIDCLNLLVEGNTAKAIGKKLKLSHRTVEHYLENCMNKMRVATRYELITKFLSYRA